MLYPIAFPAAEVTTRSWRTAMFRPFDAIADLAFPGTCAICKQRGTWLCRECAADSVPMVPTLCCDRCGHPKLGTHCECRSMHPAIVKARAVAAYGGWPAKTLHRLKYDRERQRAKLIAEWMQEPLGLLGPVDVLVPVPLHRDRHQWRGFNQSDVIAYHLGRLATVPVEHALQRVKHTESQTHLNREQRIANMDGAMAISSGWMADPTKHYVLLDDVYTTGTTLGACAEELSWAGATTISVLAFVFDLQPGDLQAYRALVSAASP